MRSPFASLVAVVALALAVTAPAAAEEVDPVDGKRTPPAPTEAPRTAPAGFGVRPADPAQSGFELAADPGGRHEDAVEVVNRSDEPIELVVSASDLDMAIDGSYGLQAPDVAPVAAGAWVSFDGEPAVTVRVDAYDSARVDFTVEVPGDAQPGDHGAAIVAASDRETEVGSVTVRQRTAVRLLVHVAGELAPALALEDVQLAYDGAFDPSLGVATVTYTLHNTGNLGLVATPTVVLSQLAGTWSSAVDGEPTALVLPGASVTGTLALDGVPALGLVEATVSVATEVAEGATAPDDLPAPSAVAQTLAVPWTVVIGIGAVLLAILLTVLASRRRGAVAERRIEERVRRELERQP